MLKIALCAPAPGGAVGPARAGAGRQPPQGLGESRARPQAGL